MADAADGAREMVVGGAEAKAVEERDGPGAHRRDVAKDPADARGRTLERLDRRRVIVALHLERHRETVVEVEHAGVLAGALEDARALARKTPEQERRVARVIRLERNYRSTHHILGAASGLIAHNEGRWAKPLWTKSGEGETVAVRGVWDGETEARLVGEEIEALQRRGVPSGEIAVLVRAGFQTREFEERFITLGLPYRVVGGPRFYERQEIRDALAYLRVVHQPDDDLAFERIVNVPRRGIGTSTLRTLHEAARGADPMVEAARRLIGTDELKPAVRRALGRLVADFDRWRAMAEAAPHTELAETVLDKSGYTAMWQEDRSPDAPGRLESEGTCQRHGRVREPGRITSNISAW